MTRIEPFDKEALRRRRRRTQFWTAAVVLLALAAVAAFFRDEFLVWRCARQMREPGADRWALMTRMVDAGPAGAKWVLRECRDGSPDGEVELLVAEMLKDAPYDVYPYVDPLLTDDTPTTRAFAVTVVGHLRDARYRPRVEKLTADVAELPSGWTDRTVSIRARRALEEIVRQPSRDAP